MTGNRRLTIEQLRVMADLNGVHADDARLARLLPLVQALWDGVASLDALDLDGVEPQTVFRAAWEAGDAPGG